MQVGRWGAGIVIFRKLLIPAASKAVVGEVRCYPEEVILSMAVALENHSCPQKAIVRFLQQFIRKFNAPCFPAQIDPQGPSRSFVYRAKAILVHLKCVVRLTDA